jgi:CrcB protein
MKQAFLVFIGGGFGSVARYFVGKYLNTPGNHIPYGTFLANVLGSLLIGLILGYLSKTSNMSQSQSLLLASGFCGGFTTFSTFAYENQLFIKNGDYLNFLFYTFISLLVGFSAVFAGIYISKLV